MVSLLKFFADYRDRHYPITPSSVLVKGQTLAKRFILVELLKASNMSLLWIALDKETNTEEVLKFPSGRDNDPIALRDGNKILQVEAKLLKRLADLPFVVDCLYAGQEQGLSFYAMPLIIGPDLRTRFPETEPLNPQETAENGWKIAWRLAQVHQRGVVCGDLRRANLMCPYPDDGQLYFIDLGIAAAYKLGLPQKNNRVFGTVPYVAPEVWRGSSISPASDVYAFGILLYKLATGIFPFNFEGAYADKPHWPHLYVTMPEHDRLPPPLANLVRSCLAKKPKDRPTANQVAQELKRIAT